MPDQDTFTVGRFTLNDVSLSDTPFAENSVLRWESVTYSSLNGFLTDLGSDGVYRYDEDGFKTTKNAEIAFPFSGYVIEAENGETYPVLYLPGTTQDIFFVFAGYEENGVSPFGTSGVSLSWQETTSAFLDVAPDDRIVPLSDSETPVNLHTGTGNGILNDEYQNNPQIAALPGGGYFIAWQTTGQDGSQVGIAAQFFDANGQRVGDEFIVNSTTSGSQFLSRVVAGPGDAVVVEWTDRSVVYATPILADGTVGRVWSSGSAGVSNGVSYSRWQTLETTETQEWIRSRFTQDLATGELGVEFARGGLDAFPQLSGTRLIVPEPNAGPDTSMALGGIERLSDGRYLISANQSVAREDGSTQINHVIYTLAANRTDLSAPVVFEDVPTTTPKIVGLSGGQFALTWVEDSVGSLDVVKLLVYDQTGQPVIEETDLATASIIRAPRIEPLPDGGFLVVWNGYAPHEQAIMARRFDAEGQPQGASVPLSLLVDEQYNEVDYLSKYAVETLADGTLAVVFARDLLDRSLSDRNDTASSDIFARFFAFNAAPESTLSMSGETIENETLTISGTVTDGDGIVADSVMETWLRDGAPIPGATTRSYVLDDADVGKAISFRQTFTDAKGRQETVETDPVVPTGVNDVPTGGISISGNGLEDSLHTVNLSLLEDADGLGDPSTYVYEWFVNGVLDASEDTASFTPRQEHVGADISVRLTYIDGQGTTETLTSPTRTIENVNDAPRGLLTFSGPIAVGGVQTADVSNITDEDGLGQFVFRWSRDFEEIPGETGQSYTLTAEDLGKTLRVRASYTDGFGGDNVVDSAGVLMDNPATGEVAIVGNLVEGQTLEADISGFSDPDGTGSVDYQWYRGGASIPAATEARYVLTSEDIGQAVSVEVRLTDPYGGVATVSSPESAPIGSISPTALGSEIQVSPNVNPPVESGLRGFDPEVIALADETFGIIWVQQRGTVGESSVVGRRYDGDGAPVGGTTTILTDVFASRMEHAIALADGGAVLWYRYDTDSSDPSTTYRAQRLDSDLSPVGPYIELADLPFGAFHTTSPPELVALPNGGFLAVWTRHVATNSDESYLFAQSFAADGTRIGPERQISVSELGSTTFGSSINDPDPTDPDSVLLASNETGALLAYVEKDLYENSWGNLNYKNYLFTQAFDAAGTSRGGLNKVEISEAYNSTIPYNPLVTPYSAIALVALASGDYLFVSRLHPGFLDSQYRGTLLNPDGTPKGVEFDFEMPASGTIGARDSGYSDRISIIPLEDGGFLLTQQYVNPDRDPDNGVSLREEVYSRRFDAEGNPVGALLKVNTESRSGQTNSNAAILSDGTILAAWQSQYGASASSFDPEGFYYDIRAQIISAAAIPVPETLPIDGTEAGELIPGTEEADVINGLGGNDWVRPLGGNDTVDGGAGIDMVDFSTTPVHPDRTNLDFMLTLDLGAGTANIFGGDMNRLVDIENVTGTIFADVLTGDAGDNRLRGLGDYDWFIATEGNDSLEGGNGLDMVSFANWGGTGAPTVTDILNPFSIDSFSGVRVDLADPGNNTNLAAGQTLDSIERITGSSHQDIFFGDGEQNDFRGLGGYDFFVGSDGGRERYFGGAGIDTVSYFNAPSGVIASLRNGPLIDGEPSGYGTAGYATRDLYFSIENFIGSRLDDQLIGNELVNQLRGLQGDDIIFGYGGNDRIRGDLGNDTLDGGAGSDFAIFAGNRADYTLTRTSSTEVTIAGPDGTDSLANVEYFVFEDTTANIWELSIA